MRRKSPVRHAGTTPVAAPLRTARAGTAAGRAGDVQLAWALDRDGKKVHAGRLDPKDREARGPFTCPGCAEPLVPHLGRVRARHFAHGAGSSCPLTAPETALHLDAKERLLALCAEAFAGARRVVILSRCPSCRRPAPIELGAAGDGAVAEGAVGPLRADVLVTARGKPALALEVKVTHAVDPEKEAALAVAGVPAIEVDAREEWEREGEGATEVVCARSLGFAPCPACSATARADADRGKGGEAAEIAELEAYRARGLLGPRPVAVAVAPSPRPSPPRSGGEGEVGAAGLRGGGEGAMGAAGAASAPLTAAERAGLIARFRCPLCGSNALVLGDRIARHACPGKAARPVAWRGYDGRLVELGGPRR